MGVKYSRIPILLLALFSHSQANTGGRMNMKCLAGLLTAILSCLLLLHSTARGESDRDFLSKTVRAKLTEPSDILEGKYGRRSVTLKRLATSDCEMRLALWTLMGEPVQTYEFRMPRLSELIFEADDGFANRITISSVGDSKENDISFHGGSTVYVSQDVLDKIQYVNFSFSIETYGLFPLPEKHRSEGNPWSFASHFKAYIHLNNPGVLEAPGEWGWDTPGSPDWSEFLSKYKYPLEEGETRLEKGSYMEEQKAREALRRMRWRYHNNKDDVFVNNWFEIYHLRVNPRLILDQIHKHAPEGYAMIIERD